MERECDYNRLYQWLLDYMPRAGLDRARFLEQLDAAFPATPAPASEPAPSHAIPEAVFDAYASAGFGKVAGYVGLRDETRERITSAIAAYREHLRAMPGPSDDELRAALDDYQFNPQCEFASRLRAVAEAVKARLLGDKP